MDITEDSQQFLLNLKTNPHQDHILSDKLGEGSFGVVWKATNIHNKKVYAMKVVPIADDLDSLVSEIKIMQQSECPFVIKQYDTFIKDEKLWILMEYCGPGSLADIMLLTGKGLKEEQISMICRCVLKGLAYLHSVNIIHRDVKAGNILISDNMSAKLTDFGVSGKVENKKTKRMSVKGSPYWMAPEVIQEVGYTYKADIWSLGITAIELAEIHPPNYDIPPERFIFMIPSRPPPTLKESNKYKPEINDFLTKCLDKDPMKRLESWELLDHSFVQNTKSVLVLENLLEDMNNVIDSCGGRDKALLKAHEKLERESNKGGSVEEDKTPSTFNMDDLNDDDIDMMIGFNEDDIFSGSDDEEDKEEESEAKGKGTYKPLFMQYLEQNAEKLNETEGSTDTNNNVEEEVVSRPRGATYSTITKAEENDNSKCKTCGQKIVGIVLKALDHNYHPNCFKCIVCSVNLQNVNFFEKHGFPYCKAHNTLLFGQICFLCGQEIESLKLVYEMDKYWHRDHFACIVCGAKNHNNLYCYDQKPYCNEHYKEKTKASCSWCNKLFPDDNYLTVHEQHWHPTCFYQALAQGKTRKDSSESVELSGSPQNGGGTTTKPRTSNPNLFSSGKNSMGFSSTPTLSTSLSPRSPVKDTKSNTGKKIIRKRIIRKVSNKEISSESRISFNRLSMREVSDKKSEDSDESPTLDIKSLTSSDDIIHKIDLSTNKKTSFQKVSSENSNGGSEKKSSIFINQKSRVGNLKGSESRSSSRSTIVLNTVTVTPQPPVTSKDINFEVDILQKKIESKVNSKKLEKKDSAPIVVPSVKESPQDEPKDRLYSFLKLVNHPDKYDNLRDSKFITPESLYSLREADLTSFIFAKKDRLIFLKIINTHLPKFIKNNPFVVEVQEERQRTRSKIENMKNLLEKKEKELKMSTTPPKQRKFCIKCGNKLSDITCEKCGTRNVSQKKVNKLNNN